MLSGAIKKYREANSTRTFRHHTMLVHESVSKAEHAATADVVRAALEHGEVHLGRGIRPAARSSSTTTSCP